MTVLSIIIPFYGQTSDELATPLNSIANQQNVDFSHFDVHLVNDGGPAIDEKSLIASYPTLQLTLHQYSENLGAGLARQYGIDHSGGEWVTFIDADDRLYGSFALAPIVNLPEDFPFELLLCDFFLQRLGDNGQINEIRYRGDKNGLDYLHAKSFKRSLLDTYNIRFHPDIQNMAEDFYFRTFVTLFAKSASLYEPIYEHLYNPNSLTTKWDNKTKVFLEVRARRLILEKIEEWKPETLQKEFNICFARLFFTMKRFGTTDEAPFWEELQVFVQEWRNLFESHRTEIFQQMQKTARENFPGIPTADFKDFYKRCQALLRN
ncbi:MAG: glycosyltransferase family 2 protein [Streptococcaceae bacterium]|jgi:glycosyltransferase involved in cell wall biosynthesis|nr:glycosyltransferase family 2 protein [Streptococcaceae bacterium]